MRILLMIVAAAPLALLDAAPAQAQVVYCTQPGIPAGCVVRPVRPVARAVAYCTRPGYPVGCTARPVARRTAAAPVARAATRPGGAMNRGGPVNRVGRR